MTEFYPIVFTRTALPLLSKGRNGFDFLLRVGPKALQPQLYRALTLLINEDHYPKLRTPRRLFLATEQYIFWGLGLYNDWFLPQETKDALDLSGGERLIRGFWGGLLPLNGLDWSARSKALRLIASTLVQNPRSCVATLDNGFDVAKPLQDGVEYDFSACRGMSDFPFAARLFQVFIERHWTATLEPRTVAQGMTARRGVPTLWQGACDLERFAEGLDARDLIAPGRVCDDMNSLALAISRREVAQVNQFWVKLAQYAQSGTCCIAPLGSQRQADLFLDFVPSFTTILPQPESNETFERYQPHATIKAQSDVTPRPLDATGNPRTDTTAPRFPTLLSSRYDSSAYGRGQGERKNSWTLSRSAMQQSQQDDDVHETGGSGNLLDSICNAIMGSYPWVPEYWKSDKKDNTERSERGKSQSQKEPDKRDGKKNDPPRDVTKRPGGRFFN